MYLFIVTGDRDSVLVIYLLLKAIFKQQPLIISQFCGCSERHWDALLLHCTRKQEDALLLEGNPLHPGLSQKSLSRCSSSINRTGVGVGSGWAGLASPPGFKHICSHLMCSHLILPFPLGANVHRDHPAAGCCPGVGGTLPPRGTSPQPKPSLKGLVPSGGGGKACFCHVTLSLAYS